MMVTKGEAMMGALMLMHHRCRHQHACRASQQCGYCWRGWPARWVGELRHSFTHGLPRLIPSSPLFAQPFLNTISFLMCIALLPYWLLAPHTHARTVHLDMIMRSCVCIPSHYHTALLCMEPSIVGSTRLSCKHMNMLIRGEGGGICARSEAHHGTL